ncbi:hypothetical protein [Haliangium sp.]|uniref:hypothetical protein n=1 Tax=Haliangium sp. TaxID=2663208 RepID=UPI003D0F2911
MHTQYEKYLYFIIAKGPLSVMRHRCERRGVEAGIHSHQTPCQGVITLPAGAAVERVPEALWELAAIGLDLALRADTSPRRGAAISLRLPTRAGSFWQVGRHYMALSRCVAHIWSPARRVEITTSDELPKIIYRVNPATAEDDNPHHQVGTPARLAAATVLVFRTDLDSIAAVQAVRATPGPAVPVVVSLGEEAPDLLQAVQGARPDDGHDDAFMATITVSRPGPAANDEHRSADSPPTPLWQLFHVVVAAAVAISLGRDEILFPENGVVNLGLPVTAAAQATPRVGTLHPAVLQRLGRLLSRICGYDFDVRNPYVGKTPTEVAATLITGSDDHVDIDGIYHAITHRSRAGGNLEERVDLSLCTLAALRADSTYAEWCERTLVPVLLAPVGAGAAGTGSMTRDSTKPGLADTGAEELGPAEVGPIERFISVVRELAEEPGAGAPLGPRPLEPRPPGPDGDRDADILDLDALRRDLGRRHGHSVRSALIRLAHRYIVLLVDGKLEPSCLLRRSLSPHSHTPATRIDESARFRQHADCWELCFVDDESIYLNDLRGLAYLHVLVQSPGRTYTAAELRAIVSGGPVAPEHDFDQLADEQALRAYRDRVRALRAELDVAASHHDLGRSERLQFELDAIEGELRRCVGLGGRPRRVGDAERARKAVSNALYRALRVIRSHRPALAEHFDSALVIGHSLSYRPQSDIEWET